MTGEDDFEDVAYVARLASVGETDRLAVLLTRDHGLLTLRARGARTSRKRLQGLQPYHRLRVRVEAQGAARRLALVEAVPDGPPPARLVEWERLEVAAWLLGLAGALLPDGEPHPGAFRAVNDALGALDRGAPPLDTAAHAAWRLLADAGWRPDPADLGAAVGAAPAALAALAARIDARGPAFAGFAEDPRLLMSLCEHLHRRAQNHAEGRVPPFPRSLRDTGP